MHRRQGGAGSSLGAFPGLLHATQGSGSAPPARTHHAWPVSRQCRRERGW
nr:MAG TPA: hypothetical protein [Caudoviricetes sp.]